MNTTGRERRRKNKAQKHYDPGRNNQRKETNRFQQHTYGRIDIYAVKKKGIKLEEAHKRAWKRPETSPTQPKTKRAAVITPA